MDRREAIKKISFALLCIPGLVFVTGGRPRFKELRLQRDEIPPGVSIQDGVLIVKDDKELKIFSQKCTHLGCNVNYDNVNGIFVCPCHGSRFAIDGTNLKGPATKALLKLSYISNQDGSIVVKVPI